MPIIITKEYTKTKEYNIIYVQLTEVTIDIQAVFKRTHLLRSDGRRSSERRAIKTMLVYTCIEYTDKRGISGDPKQNNQTWIVY